MIGYGKTDILIIKHINTYFYVKLDVILYQLYSKCMHAIPSGDNC